MLLFFFLNFKEIAFWLRDNQTQHDAKNASIWNYFGVGVNNKCKCDESTMFPVSLENLDLQLNS